MANSVTISNIQQLDLIVYRGEEFTFTINVKNADGSNYDFSQYADADDTTKSADRVNIWVTRKPFGNTFIGNAYAAATSEPADTDNETGGFQYNEFNFSTDHAYTESGKIVLKTNGPLSAWPGIYYYTLVTHGAPGNNSYQYNNKYWLHGKFIVKGVGDFNYTA